MKTRTLLIIMFLGVLIAPSIYYIKLSDELAVNAAPGSEVQKPALETQALSSAEVARPLTDQNQLYRDDLFGYHLSLPTDWTVEEAAPNVRLFTAPDGLTTVRVEAVGPLAVDGLTGFVNRSLGENIVISRQSLTIHGAEAERVLVHSDAVQGLVTQFYVDAGHSAFVIEGLGEQAAVEMMARSLNAPQAVVLP